MPRPGNLVQRFAQGPGRGDDPTGGIAILARVLKLLLMSVLFATFLLPAAAASGKKPLSALRAMLISFLLAELAYAFFLRFIYHRLV